VGLDDGRRGSVSTPGASTAPVFLIGAPRSGTTLLYKCLALSPSFSYISNYNERLPRWELTALLNRIPARLPELRRKVWFGGAGGNAYVYNEGRPLVHKLLPMPTEGESIFTRVGLPEASVPPDAPTAEEAAALARTFEQLRRRGGGRRLLNKRIANNLRIPFLAETFPDASFVVLTRDGRAVANSLRKVNWWPDLWVFWYGSTTRQWEASGGDPWELAGRHWVEEVSAIERGVVDLPVGRVLRLSYEDFATDPVGHLAQLSAELGVPPRPDWLAEIDRLSYPTTTDGWRSTLTGDALATVERVQRDTLRRYGYA